MGLGEEREREALEWVEALAPDAATEPISLKPGRP